MPFAATLWVEKKKLMDLILTILRPGLKQSKGCERPSMSASLIKNFDRNGLSSQEMAWLIGTL
jgi:hypothetical protein